MKRTALLIPVFLCLAAAQDVPRAEYPQPQFQRESWQTLNGRWDFEFDDANAGIKQEWPLGAKKFSRSIIVPFAFETAKSGIGDTSFHPYVWYRRTFTIPEAWSGKTVLLHFGAVDYHALVWVNGRFAGEHEGGNTPLRFDITPLLKAGANTLVVRAEDQPTDIYMPRGKQYWQPKSDGIFYTRTTGIWQPVWLEAAGPAYLEKVRITPTNDGIARFQAKLAGTESGLEFHAIVKDGERVIATAVVPITGDRASAAAQVREPKLWWPGRPALYDTVFEIRKGGTVLDRVHSYFGFREVSIERGRLAINGRPVYLKFVLDQGYWPESTLTPPSDDAIQYDIRMTREMGFNGARKHQKAEDPRFLYWADKTGFLVSGEIASAFDFDEIYVSRMTREWTEAVERDYNHPSVIMWIPLNESWGVPTMRDARQRAFVKTIYNLTHSLDSTRPAIDNDGWEHTDTTDLFGIHDYVSSGDVFSAKYKDLGKPGASVPDIGRPALAPGATYNGSPVFLTEFGGIAWVMPGSKVPEQSWGYSGVEKTREDALNRLRGLYKGIAQVPAVIGICYTQLTDVEQEINGLMTFDRKPKFDPKDLREINALLP